ncbi:MAG TPA: hypothetical protein PKA64_14990, partial [Myxococcota bacterium]|nr:hypothetical protein [Myxococcota bacterium]
RPSRAARVTVDGLAIAADPRGGARAIVAGDTAWPGLTIELHHPDVSGHETWQVWLSMAQHLGRIQARSPERGWSPRVRLIAPIPARLHEARLSTHALLEQAAWRDVPAELRPLALCLRGWLDLRDRFERRESPPIEVLDLHALRYERDVRQDFRLLDAVLDAHDRSDDPP